MKIISVLFLSCITLCAFGQPSELVCYDPTPLPIDPVGMRSNISDLQPLLERATELTNSQLEGLSVDEAAAAVPEILNHTGFTLFIEAFNAVNDNDFSSFPSLGDVTLVVFQSLLDSTNGMEIAEKMVQDPNNFVRSLVLTLQNYDLNCISNPREFVMAVSTSMISDLLQEPFRDSFVNIFNATVVGLAIRNNDTETFISVLGPFSESLDELEGVGGALGSLVSLISEDTINVALSAAFKSSGLFVEPETLAAIMGSFYARVQSSFELDGPEFVTFLNDILKDILAALQ